MERNCIETVEMEMEMWKWKCGEMWEMRNYVRWKCGDMFEMEMWTSGNGMWTNGFLHSEMVEMWTLVRNGNVDKWKWKCGPMEVDILKWKSNLIFFISTSRSKLRA